VHPTRQCNLRCRHCYSLSSPQERGALDAALICDALSDASQQGYDVASFSGGEPLMYKPLADVLDHAHQCGMTTTVTTNGMLLDKRWLKNLTGRADLIAISLDGVPESHDVIRGSKRAFSQMANKLASLRDSGIPFGFIFTLTQYNLDELDWVAAFALEQGARLLQIHPLEDVGRAREEMAGEHPDEVESAYAMLEVQKLKDAIGEQMHVHIDLIDREYLKTDPAKVFADELSPAELAAAIANCSFADLVSPLVIEADGHVVPIEYGFARDYALGDLHTARLSELMNQWRETKLGSFRALCRRVFQATTTATTLPFFNWYEVIDQMAAGR
jgi:MoaA/NifB/PqqE/SkfB family radical SAM enzyme